MEISWRGPFQIQTYLDNAISRDTAWQDRWPRERDAVYVISEREWKAQPDEAAHILYVGGNTGETARFITRIGDLIADLFGFYGEETGHHCGGQTLWKWCDLAPVHEAALEDLIRGHRSRMESDRDSRQGLQSCSFRDI